MGRGVSFILLILLLIHYSFSIAAEHPDTMVLTRVNEPKEQAFSILIPQGWITEGGIFRIDPLTAGGPAQSIAAKLDFTVKSDAQGTVLLRSLPDIMYFDARSSPAGQMGLITPGSNYQGMTVIPVMSADMFIQQIVIPYVHPGGNDIRIVEGKKLSDLAESIHSRIMAIMPGMTFSYDAALVTIEYTENGTLFREKIIAVIENWGQLGAGMWGNKETSLVRAPADQFGDWEPVFKLIRDSVTLNPTWLAGEMRGQMQRSEIVRDTQREIQRIDREITEHRSKTNAEINNDMFLTLTEQEEYVNPYTNEIETGSNQWRYRWINESGDVIYTDKESYDPNIDVNLNRSDFKKTPIRKRGTDN